MVRSFAYRTFQPRSARSRRRRASAPSRWRGTSCPARPRPRLELQGTQARSKARARARSLVLGWIEAAYRKQILICGICWDLQDLRTSAPLKTWNVRKCCQPFFAKRLLIICQNLINLLNSMNCCQMLAELAKRLSITCYMFDGAWQIW